MSPPADLVIAAAGSRLEVPLRLEIPAGLHINSEKPTTEYLIPTRLEWTSQEFRLLRVVYPPAERYRFSFAPGKSLNVYRGTISIRSRFHVPREAETKKVTLRGVLRYQACDDKACYPPEKVEVEARVHVINVREGR